MSPFMGFPNKVLGMSPFMGCPLFWTLASAGKRKWEKFLHAHRLYRPETSAKRIELFGAAAKSVSPNPAVTAAKSLLAVSLARQLRLLPDLARAIPCPHQRAVRQAPRP
jgi:hypothetical protein